MINVIQFLELILCAQAAKIILPVHLESEWVPVHFGERICQSNREKIPNGIYSSLKIEGKVPVRQRSEEADGYYCHKTVYSVLCDFKWYGVKKLRHSVKRDVPSYGDCLKAIDDMETGLNEYIGFPPPSCNYLVETRSQNTEVILSKHQVKIDDYKQSWMDSTFVDGGCRKAPCLTTIPGTLWIPSSNLTAACDISFKTQEFTVYYPKIKPQTLSSDHIFITSPYHPVSSLSKSCEITLCNKKGIRLPGGSWTEMGSHTSFHGIKVDTLLPKCQSSVEIYATPPDLKNLRMIWDLEKVIENTLCQATWDKIETRQKITPLDLNYLSPSEPGPGWGFLPRNGSMYKAQILYIRAEVEGDTVALHQRYNKEKEDFYFEWNDWEMLDGIRIGPNGIITNGTHVKVPYYSVGIGKLDEEMMIPQQIEIIHHIDHLKQRIPAQSNLDRTWIHEGENGDIITSVSHWWHDILMHSWELFASLGGLCVLFCMCSCCLNRRRGRKTRHQEAMSFV
uniref:Glycoprotein n=1 Tax=American bat vesiculovirus TaxID=1972564 RepID=A0A7T0Q954_9RHAB|nr:glycoprotein [American bat vesiculovirus]